MAFCPDLPLPKPWPVPPVPGPAPWSAPLNGATEECQARRIAFRTEVQVCMEQMHAEADARAGQPTRINAHTSRARFLMCDAATRERQSLLAD